MAEPEPLYDDESGLFSGSYFRHTLNQRVATARRHLHPMSIALVRPLEAVPLKRAVEAVLATVRESDTACRLEDGTFALILEDTPENGAVWTVERLRQAIVELTGTDVSLWAGVACYPAHSLEADDLLSRAESALDAACEWPQHRIEVALPD